MIQGTPTNENVETPPAEGATGPGGATGDGGLLPDDPAEAIDAVGTWAEEFGPKLLAALAILVIGYFLARLVTAAVKKALGRTHIDPTLTIFVGNLVYAIAITFVVVAAISKVGVETTSFVAILGAAGFAVGFALQGSLSNFAAGVMLLIFRPFRVGDLIEAGGAMGTVQEISIFTTILNTLDNRRVIVSNSSITDGNIINYSTNDTRRVDMTFGIGYGDDIPKAMEVLTRVVKSHPKVLAEPEPDVAVCELGDSSVNFVVRPWCRPDDYWTVYFDIHRMVKMELDAEGISIPFPQRDVHLYQATS